MDFSADKTYSSNFSKALRSNVLLLDGGMGTMLQKDGAFEGPAELLNITDPQRVINVHKAYIEAGANIITTNTFSAHAVSLAEYNLSERAEEFAFSGAQLARKAIEFYNQDDRLLFVAGSMGPTNRSLTLDSKSVRLNFEQMATAYQAQARGLIRGGVDVLLIETIFDLMNAKAAVEGAKRAMNEVGKRVDIWLSFTLADEHGRLLTGYHLDHCVMAMCYAHPTLISLNCGFGPKALLPFAKRLSEIFDGYVGIYPNAGLPDASGKYSMKGDEFAAQLLPILSAQKLNVVGGCCGTTNEHIGCLKKVLVDDTHGVPKREQLQQSNNSCLVVGERCNVAGSRLFSTMVAEGRYDDATNLALRQLDHGAWAIDINVDAPLIDGEREMLKLIESFTSNPKLIGVPFVIDSSNWEVVKRALNAVSGKLIINSISLKDGEDLFLQKARLVQTYGAGLVVMAADESGQATTYTHRMSVCKRSYQLLREKLDFPAEDIIFDPNVLAICTGVEEHMNYASDLLKTIKALRELFPKSHIIGGLSNLSFAFRGCDPIRKALHSAFLHYATQVGMDMVILNPSSIIDYDTIPQELRQLLDDAILRGIDVTSDLLEWGTKLKSATTSSPTSNPNIDTLTPEERLTSAILKGQSQTLTEDVNSLLQKYSPLEIISTYLMQGMERVGELFGNGQLFLPQVIRSAEIMSRVVEMLQPYMPTNHQETEKAKVIMATVKGDVHDIGKNICATLLRCNGFEVIDLGVMVHSEKIVEATIQHQPLFIGLSGLITPSLVEMQTVIEACKAARLKVPVLIGGATTSAEHTACCLAPCYDYPVLWTPDASQLVILAQKLYAPDSKQMFSTYVEELQNQQIKCREERHEEISLRSLSEARKSQVSLY